MSSPDHGAHSGRSHTDGGVRILDELATLTRGGASGALRIDGDPGGAIYLDEGRLVFAEAAGVPDVGARLIGARRLSPEEWTTLRAVDRPPGGLGALLVERGLIGRDEMLAVLRSACLDALTALTLPMTGSASVNRLWFAALERPWIGSMLALEVESVRSEISRRAGLLAETDVSLDALLVGVDLSRPFGVVRREQWAVASRMDGVTPLRDLAWRNGLALYDTVESAGGLVGEGLCALLAAPAAPPAPAPRWAPPEDGDAGDGPPPLGPFWRDPGGIRSNGPGRPAAPILPAPVPVADPAVTDPRVEAAPPAAGDPRAGVADGDDDTMILPAAGLFGGTGEPPAPPMPRRRPGASLWERLREEAGSIVPPALEQAAPPSFTPPAFTPPTPELLRRLLDGLRRLDENGPPSR